MFKKQIYGLCAGVATLAIAAVLSFSSESGPRRAPASELYTGSSFSQVWAEVKRNPYEVGRPLPVEPLSLKSIREFLRADGFRTLTDESDLLEFEHGKLIRPNGICLAGTWTIQATHPKGYTGLFKAGTRVPIIARASV